MRGGSRVTWQQQREQARQIVVVARKVATGLVGMVTDVGGRALPKLSRL